jgi:hypothetical protein
MGVLLSMAVLQRICWRSDRGGVDAIDRNFSRPPYQMKES